MKPIHIKQTILVLLAFCLFLTIMSACEQENPEPDLNAAPGGGTISTYKAYTLEAVPGMGDVYGRVVFWQDNNDNTLVQISLYNTVEDSRYPTSIFSGTAAEGLATTLEPLYDVDGTTGEFSVSKFYVISDKTFFSSLDTYNANVRVSLGGDIVASGDVGANAEPVAAGD